MGGKEISLSELVCELDMLFSIHDWDTDPGMSRFVPRVYQGIGFDHATIFEADFCERFDISRTVVRQAIKELQKGFNRHIASNIKKGNSILETYFE